MNISPKIPKSISAKYLVTIVVLLMLCLMDDLTSSDSEATESSSGGDSADEFEKFPPGGTKYAPIRERALYRWLQKVNTLKV